LDSCIEYCQQLVKTTKYTTINNIWDCIDEYAKIPPRIYGEKKCKALAKDVDRTKIYVVRKECYDKLNINKENSFLGIYDAKLSYCKTLLRAAVKGPAFLPGGKEIITRFGEKAFEFTPAYEKWYWCNYDLGVKYDE
jgi:hypothetical protein